MSFIDQLVDQLKSRITKADDTMSQLAQQVEGNNRRRAAYDQLEDLFSDAAEDGYLDASEIQNLISQFKAQGLDTKALENIAKELRGRDGVSKVEVTDALRTKIGNELFDAKTSTRDPALDFQIQIVSEAYKNDIGTASTIRKAEHDAYMDVIRKIGSA